MLINQKVLIKLDEHFQHTETSSISIPLYERDETDGGRPSVKVSDKKYLLQGVVVDVSPSANELLSKDNITLTKGTKVFVNQSAFSPSFQYFPSRDSLVIPFDGHILIPVTLIDSIHE